MIQTSTLYVATNHTIFDEFFLVDADVAER